MAMQREPTTFDGLPDLVREQIFKILHSDPDGALKNARLVSRSWYIFLTTHQFKISGTLTTEGGGTLRDKKSLQMLESCFQPELAKLEFKNCGKTLPILSSTRITFPSAKKVSISEGVSEDNLRALLRYYCSTSSTKGLTFLNNCFLDCGADFMKTHPLQVFRFYNLTSLSVICGLSISTDNASHWNAMNLFLSRVQMPKLREFSFRQNCFSPIDGDGDNLHAIASWGSYVGAIGAFVQNHATQLRSLHVCLMGSRYTHIGSILRRLNVLKNLEEFRCSYTGSKLNMLRLVGNVEERHMVNEEFERLFRTLTRLRTLVMMTADQELRLNQMFVHVSPRLNAVSMYIRGLSSLAWIHQHAHVNRGSSVGLLDLYFSVRNNPFRDIRNNSTIGLKYQQLPNLHDLKLLLFRDSTRPPVGPAQTVYEDCVDWILQYAPNLRRLQLSFYSDQVLEHELTVDQMKRLITEVQQLEELSWSQITNYGVPQGPQLIRPRLDLETDPKVAALRTWYASPSTNQRGMTFSVKRAKNYHYTNFTNGTDELICARINRAVFKVY